jgi:hypothetical protein
MQLKSSGGETTGKIIRKKTTNQTIKQPSKRIEWEVSTRVSIILHRDKSCFRPCYSTTAQSVTWSGHMVSEKPSLDPGCGDSSVDGAVELSARSVLKSHLGEGQRKGPSAGC